MKISAKKIGVLVLAVLLIAVGAYGGLCHWEWQQAASIASLLSEGKEESKDLIESEKFGVSLNALEGSLTIVNFKGQSSDPWIKELFPNLSFGDFSFEFSEISVKGKRPDAASKKEILQLADKITISGVKFKLNDGDLTQEVEIDVIAVDDLTGDLGTLTELIASGSRPDMVFNTLEKFKAGKVTVLGYKDITPFVSTEASFPIIFSIDSFEMRDMGILDAGTGIAKGIKSSALGMDVFSIGQVSLQKLTLPNLLTPIAEANLNPAIDLPTLLLKTIADKPIQFVGGELTDATIRPAKVTPVTIGKLTFDLVASPEKMALRAAVNDLAIPDVIYRRFSPDFSQLAAQYNKPLVFSGRIDMTANQKNGQGEVAVRDLFLKEENLLAISLQQDMLFTSPDNSLESLIAEGPDFAVKKSISTLEDTGVIELLFKTQYEQMKAWGVAEGVDGPEALRQRTVAALREEAEKVKNSGEAPLFLGLAQLIEKPGKLTTTIVPDEPVSISAVVAHEISAGQLNAEVEYTPAQ